MGNSLCGILDGKAPPRRGGSGFGVKGLLASFLKMFILLNYLWVMYYIFSLLFNWLRTYLCSTYGSDGKCCRSYTQFPQTQSTASQCSMGDCISCSSVNSVECQTEMADDTIPEDSVDCIQLTPPKRVASKPKPQPRSWRLCCPFVNRFRQRCCELLSTPRTIQLCPDLCSIKRPATHRPTCTPQRPRRDKHRGGEMRCRKPDRRPRSKRQSSKSGLSSCDNIRVEFNIKKLPKGSCQRKQNCPAMGQDGFRPDQARVRTPRSCVKRVPSHRNARQPDMKGCGLESAQQQKYKPATPCWSLMTARRR